jgi:hypothetical protein
MTSRIINKCAHPNEIRPFTITRPPTLPTALAGSVLLPTPGPHFLIGRRVRLLGVSRRGLEVLVLADRSDGRILSFSRSPRSPKAEHGAVARVGRIDREGQDMHHE